MNNIVKLSALMLATISIFACEREVSAPTPNARPEKGDAKVDTVLVETTFQARLGASRSSVWNGDVLVYDNVATHEANVFKPGSVEGLRAELTGQSYDPCDMYYALYPSTAFDAFSEGKATRTVPAEQKAYLIADGTELPAVPQVAFAQALETSLLFNPVASYLNFNMLAEDVESLKLTSIDKKTIAGTATVDVYSRDVTAGGEAESISITPQEGDVFSNATYSVEILPGVYEQGFVVDITFKGGAAFSNTFSSPLTVNPGEVVLLGNVFSPKVTAPVLKNAVAAFTDAHLSWDAIESADGYKVYVNDILAGDVNECSFTAKGLQQGAECRIKVEAYNAYSSASSTVDLKTKGLRKSDVSTGTTFLCIDWDAVCRNGITGYDQAYQVQIFEDEACTKQVYDFVPYDGQKMINPCFGNSSYFGHTSQLQDGLECVNYLTPTRVSIGGLYPATTYYVRIRTLKSISMKNGLGKANVTLTNSFGTSEWSQPVAMATDNERALDERTVFYTGFNDFCVQSDYKAWAPGAVPAGSIAGTALGGCWIPWNHPNRNKSIGFAFYPHGEGQHQTNTWNLTSDGKHVDGTSGNNTGGYLIGRAKGSVNAITGDVAGWIFGRWARPFMGMVGLDGADNGSTIVCTPVIPAGRVDAAGSECTITFSAVARVRPQDNFSGTLQVNVWHAESKKWETIGIVSSEALLPFTPGASESEYKCDFTGHVHTFKTTLKPGDAVELRTTKRGIILVDDFTVVRGNNIDGVSRGEINW